MLPQERRLAKEHVEVLGKRSPEVEVEKFVQANIISVVDGMSKCCLCYKRFTNIDYATMHMHEKHSDKIEEVNAPQQINSINESTVLFACAFTGEMGSVLL